MLTVDIIDHPIAFSGLKEEWDLLLAQCPHRTPFLTHDWMSVWWKHFGAGKQLHILVVRERGRAVAIAPLMRYRGDLYDRFAKIPVRVVETMANHHSNRVDIIHSGYRQDILGALWNCLVALKGWDLFRLYPVAADSPSVEGFRHLAERERIPIAFVNDQTSPYMVLDQGWQAFTRNISGEILRRGRKGERMIADGRLRFENHSGEGEIDTLMSDVFTVADSGWAAHEGTAVSSTIQLRRFYSDLARLAARRGWLSLWLLKMEGRPIAFEYNLRYEQTIYCLKVSFDPSHARIGPGHTLKYLGMSRAMENGQSLKEYDLLGGVDPFKLKWTQCLRPHLKIFLYHPKSPYGRLLHLVQGRLVEPLKAKWWHDRRAGSSLADSDRPSGVKSSGREKAMSPGPSP